MTTTLSPNAGILLCPTKCSVTGTEFTEGNQPVVLKCGCVLCMVEADKCTTPSGFVFCPICEFTYNVSDKMDSLTKNNKLEQKHVDAQQKRCGVFFKEINQLCTKLDTMISESEPEFDEKEQAYTWLDVSDSSSVSGSSESDLADYLNFESTEHALFQRNLKRLRQRRDALLEKQKAKAEKGEALGKPWHNNPDWKPDSESIEAAKIAARVERRKARRALREKRFEERQARRGAYKVVHNVHVLGKDVPKKWRTDNPNAEKPANWEEKEREKKGWLNEEEQAEMDDEQQEEEIAKRRAAWKAAQGKVPKIPNSVQRQRWAERLYRNYRREFFLTQKLEEKKDDAKQTGKLEKRKQIFAARTEATRAKCAERVAKLEGRGFYEKAKALADLFEEAEKIGKDEVEAEEEEKRKKAEEERLAAERAAEAKARAEEKARQKAEAEARGEVWVDPDENKDGEGDEGDE